MFTFTYDPNSGTLTSSQLLADQQQLSDFILDAKAMNPANMLSSQLIAMELNVLHEFTPLPGLPFGTGVNPSMVINDPGLAAFASTLNSLPGVVTGVSSSGNITIADLMTAANDELGIAPDPTPGSFDHSFETEMITALSDANNGLNFVS